MREEVADVIRNAILVGELPRGSRLDVLAIAGDMSVSQLPVREALIALTAEGLVRTEARRGYYVETIDRMDVLDYFEICGKIEGIAAARAAEVISPTQLDELRTANERMRSSLDPEEQEALNQEFHGMINLIGGSRRLRSVLRPMSRGMDHFGNLIPDWHSDAADQHDAVLAALTDNNAEAARTAMEQHLIVNGRKAADALESAGYFTT